jgi:hypothetical protein
VEVWVVVKVTLEVAAVETVIVGEKVAVKVFVADSGEVGVEVAKVGLMGVNGRLQPMGTQTIAQTPIANTNFFIKRALLNEPFFYKEYHKKTSPQETAGIPKPDSRAFT